MKDFDMSENKEALIVLAETIIAALAAFILGTNYLPGDLEVPVSAMLGAIATAILLFWKQKVNILEDE